MKNSDRRYPKRERETNAGKINLRKDEQPPADAAAENLDRPVSRYTTLYERTERRTKE